jgi:hypothetical protein
LVVDFFDLFDLDDWERLATDEEEVWDTDESGRERKEGGGLWTRTRVDEEWIWGLGLGVWDAIGR